MNTTKSVILAVCILVSILSFPACKNADETAPLNPPNVVYFGADATEIFRGTEVKLSWNVWNAATVEIDNGIGAVPASGSVPVKPESTTTYTLTARNSDGTVQNKVTINVRVYLVSWYKKVKSYGSPYILGTVKNIGDKPIYNVKISWAAYNANNTIIDTADGFPGDLGTISPGISAVFEAIFFNLSSWNQIYSLTYTISWITSSGVAESFTERVK